MSPYVIPGLKGVLLTSFPNTLKIESLKEILLKYNRLRQPMQYTWHDVQGKSRKRELVLLRHMYCYFCMKYQLFPSLVTVGEDIGNRDHTSVIHAVRTIENHLNTQNASTIDLFNFVNNNL